MAFSERAALLQRAETAMSIRGNLSPERARSPPEHLNGHLNEDLNDANPSSLHTSPLGVGGQSHPGVTLGHRRVAVFDRAFDENLSLKEGWNEGWDVGRSSPETNHPNHINRLSHSTNASQPVANRPGSTTPGAGTPRYAAEAAVIEADRLADEATAALEKALASASTSLKTLKNETYNFS